MDLRQSNVGISKESKAVKPFGIKDKVGYLCGGLRKRFYVYIRKYVLNGIFTLTYGELIHH